jgi:beta-lactam-binding protein with PASTA domain
VTTKKSAQEVWRQAVEEADHEVGPAADVSVAQAEKELAEAGFDVAAERAKGEAFLAALESGQGAVTSERPAQGARVPGGAAPAATKRHPSARTRWVAVLAAAAVVAVVIAIAVPKPDVVAHGRPSAEELARAADLRRKAFEACDARRYKECREGLDQARTLDPDGEQAPEVKARRRVLQDVPGGP